MPILGTMPVERIKLAHILEVLQPIWHEKTETASRVPGGMEKVLDYAAVSGFREGEYPARWRGKLDAILPAPTKLKKVQHHRAFLVDNGSIPPKTVPGTPGAVQMENDNRWEY